MSAETEVRLAIRAKPRSQREWALAKLADLQHGVVSRRQLEEAGWGRAAIGRLIASGRLRCLHRGVFAVGHRQLTAKGRWLAAVLAGGDDGVASHQLAGAIWGLISWRGVPHVTVPRRVASRPQLRLHHCRLPPDEIAVRNGIPVTTVGRTLLDLAAVLPRDRLERALNEAEYRRYADSPSLSDLIERHRGARGLATLRAILNHRGLGESITRSELENRFLSLIDKHELPRPQTNAGIQAAGRWFEADCVWPPQRLTVELDGHAAHSTRAAFERDRERDRLLQSSGWRVVRITWRQLHRDRASVVADLRRLLA